MNRTRLFVLSMLLSGDVLLPTTGSSALSREEGSATVSGMLIIESGKGAYLRAEGKDIRLTSTDKSTAAALQDSRISGRKLNLRGNFRDDGSFEIHKFHVVRRDGFYRLIYFCET